MKTFLLLELKAGPVFTVALFFGFLFASCIGKFIVMKKIKEPQYKGLIPIYGDYIIWKKCGGSIKLFWLWCIATIWILIGMIVLAAYPISGTSIDLIALFLYVLLIGLFLLIPIGGLLKIYYIWVVNNAFNISSSKFIAVLCIAIEPIYWIALGTNKKCTWIVGNPDEEIKTDSSGNASEEDFIEWYNR